jgi:uncharacterized membrane protein
MRLQTLQVVKLSLFFLCSAFTACIILAPAYQPSNTIKDLSGSVGIFDNKNVTWHMAFPWNYIYTFGDVWCHQKSERSFFINGNQMPVCARCFGIFLGVPIGICFSILSKTKIDKNIHKKFLIPLISGYSPLAVDEAGQLAGLWHSTNIIRMLTGISAGLAFGFILSIAMDVVNIALSTI